MNTNHKLIEPWQLKKMHTLLSKTGMTAYKIDLMDEFAEDNRYIGSSTDLRYEEAQKLINHLLALQAQSPEGQSLDRQRKKVISCCREMGMNKGGKADMKQVYNWVLKHGGLNKTLNKYTLEELPKLVTQATMMRDKYLKGV